MSLRYMTLLVVLYSRILLFFPLLKGVLYQSRQGFSSFSFFLLYQIPNPAMLFSFRFVYRGGGVLMKFSVVQHLLFFFFFFFLLLYLRPA
jgi:hypothetical protein